MCAGAIDAAGPRPGPGRRRAALGDPDHEGLGRAQAETDQSLRRRYGAAARLLFGLLDTLYGKPRTLSKFKVLELVARVPYLSWEQVAYFAVTHAYEHAGLARRIYDRVAEARASRTTSSGIL
jgi:ubiquinol oxidase